MINIFIADDHAIIREGLKKIVAEESDMKIVGEAESAIEVREKISGLKADIILLDLNMPGSGYFDLIKELRNLLPELYILIVTMYSEEQYAIRSIKAGANGYITKNETLNTLVTAIRSIINSGKYINPKLSQLLTDELFRDKTDLPHHRLSDREIEVLCKIAEGKKVKDIAAELHLTVSTVNTYRLRILEKMNMKSNVELARYAMENNLIR
jgi:DNA-binding NarL/FixJ family response regulator